MKIIWLTLIFIFASCQLAGRKKISSNRDVASLFKSNSKKFSYDHQWKIGATPTWIVNSNIKNVTSIEVHSSQVTCNGKNIVKVHADNKQVFYLTKKSKVQCFGEKTIDVVVSYNYYGQTLVDLSKEQILLIKNVLDHIDENKMHLVLDDLKKLGLYNLFKTQMSLNELRKINFSSGDYIQLEITPQKKLVNCPDGKCSFEVDVFGILEYDKLSFIKGMNQLKYQGLPPYVFFCGSRYAAGNIYFRADVKMDFEHFVDENGFSCDVNSFMLSENKDNYEITLNWISKEKIQTILMGKPEVFVEQKNQAIENEILTSINYIENLNKVYQHEFYVSGSAQSSKGYIELWWEPFDKCDSHGNKLCKDKEMIMTRSRLIQEGSEKSQTVELNLVSLGLKQVIDSEDPIVAFVVKLCPEDIEDFVFDQMNYRNESNSESSFKSRIMDYQKDSCEVQSHTNSFKDFEFRWLLATVPKKIEKEEVDLVIEDYQLIESPEEQKLKSDPFQKGKIFFDIYIKNLKKRELPFKRSRIIEVTK